ncbi:MAG: FtsQ-type POTRA domain-containing protein [Bacteroidota bacterium]|nr:FtsQ-type POTRA domain-containing protein [Bacteroidota bacterium]
MRKIISWFILIIILIVVAVFVYGLSRKTICKNLIINIDTVNGKNYFIDENDIKRILSETGNDVIGKPLYKINLNQIEKTINNDPSVDKAEVYSKLDGTIKIKVRQRVPILRIMNKRNESYYIDEKGGLMPVSEKYSARVLVANGYISQPYSSYKVLFNNKGDSIVNKTLISDLFLLAKFIRNSEFWNSQIDQIYVNENTEIELVPKTGEHEIILGDIEDMKDKFNKLMVFYLKGLNYIGWDIYKTINLKYKNQVVCSKN